MAKFVPATTNKVTNSSKGGFIMNVVRVILHFFKSLFTMFRKERTPSHRDILNKEYDALFKENEILEEVRNLLRRGWSSWNDPYTYLRVCELIKEIPSDPDRYNGAGELNDYAGGVFYYYDKDTHYKEISYTQMSEEYRLLQRCDAIPRQWDKAKFGNSDYSYLHAMKQIRLCHLPNIKVHADIRFKKNAERMEAIQEELFGAVPA